LNYFANLFEGVAILAAAKPAAIAPDVLNNADHQY
jgi:hypothetical protein